MCWFRRGRVSHNLNHTNSVFTARGGGFARIWATEVVSASTARRSLLVGRPGSHGILRDVSRMAISRDPTAQEQRQAEASQHQEAGDSAQKRKDEQLFVEPQHTAAGLGEFPTVGDFVKHCLFSHRPRVGFEVCRHIWWTLRSQIRWLGSRIVVGAVLSCDRRSRLATLLPLSTIFIVFAGHAVPASTIRRITRLTRHSSLHWLECGDEPLWDWPTRASLNDHLQ